MQRARSIVDESFAGGTRAVAAPPLGISVVVPVWNEADQLPGCLASAVADGVEILVVDGASTDGSADVARCHGARVVASPRGRGSQLRVGAEAALGEILVFLHADARLPDRWSERVRETLRDSETIVGAFTLRIDGRSRAFRCVEWGVRQRCRIFGLPYGDQALFVRAADYRDLGGFPALPAMEDFEFVRKARRKGRVKTLDAAVTISSRAWNDRGVVRMTAINVASACAYACGVSAERIARWRRRRR